MPELPDLNVYTDAMTSRLVGKRLTNLRVTSPFLVRSVAPSIDEARGEKVTGIRRIGKRIAIGFENGNWWVIHLMVAGRLRWRDAEPQRPGRAVQAVFTFEPGVILLTEPGRKKKASIHVVADESKLEKFNAGGLEIDGLSLKDFTAAITRENHTLKRALTDPKILSGIGNAFSDEILHSAKLSPVKQTESLSKAEIKQLFDSTRQVLDHWTAKLRDEADNGFPEKVTAFKDDMAVHGRFGEPCPVCETAVQRIKYASNETNYCPRCQTEGKMLADRDLSQLLKSDWPKSIAEWEERFSA